MKVIILAGGSGTRLWPLSREHYPKQFIKLQGRTESLFQETFKRSLLVASLNDIFIVTNQKYKFLVMGEIEELGYSYNEENILIEPEAKNTLPAIYAGVNEIVKKGNDYILVFPSDHMIEKNEEFIRIINQSIELATKYIVTFGVTPDNPNTGYGYISQGEKILNGFLVSEFKEKPNLEKAKEYTKNGYCWNSGIFMFESNMFRLEVEKYAYEIYSAFSKGRTLEEAFSEIKTKISIDYGILEKSENVAIVPISIGWNDLGSFDSFYDAFQENENDNISDSKNIIINSINNLIQSYDGKIVATIGVEDLIIIDNRDALLVCRKDESQKVKEVIDILKARNDTRKDYGVQDYRPWGQYKVLEEEKNRFKIKKITVNQGKKLSYQLHHHRSEHWIVVSGMAKVIVDDEVKFVRPGESIFFKEGQKHRLENPGKIPLEIIEVQMGQYLEEDDIVRFDDEYGRE